MRKYATDEERKAAIREQSKRTCEKALAEMAANPNDPRHGTTTGYAKGCKCAECHEANRAAQYALAVRRRKKEGRERYERRPVPRYAIIREMRLAGASNQAIADRLGYARARDIPRIAKRLGLPSRGVGRPRKNKEVDA